MDDDEPLLSRRRANATVSVVDESSESSKPGRSKSRQSKSGEGMVLKIEDGKVVRRKAKQHDAIRVDDDGEIIEPATVTVGQSTTFELVDPEAHKREKLISAAHDRDIPPPFSNTTRVKTKASQANFIRERLVADKDVFDQEVLFLCRKYHGQHRRQHEILKAEHQKQNEDKIMQQPLRDRVFTIFEDPQSCSAGRVLAIVELLLVLVTLLQFMLETVPRFDPSFRPEMENVWFGMELFVTLFFTIETMIRFALSRDKIGFFKNIPNLFDLIAVLPFYVLLFIETSGLGFIKVLRMFRFVKLFRRFRHIDALIVTMSNIAASLSAPILFLLVSVILIASFLYFVEGGRFLPVPDAFVDDLRLQYSNSSSWSGATGARAVQEAVAHSKYNKFYVQDCYCTSTPSYIVGNRTCPDIPSKFDSILQAMWFGVVTITTTGYGDFVPVCAGGKLIASVGLLLSTIFLAMPIAIVGESFTETVAAMNERDVAKKKATATNIAQLRMNAEMAEEGSDEKRDAEQSARVRTAGEGLLMYLAATLRVRSLCPNNPCITDGFGDDQDVSDDVRQNAHDSDWMRRRLQLAHHMNAYLTTLLETWVGLYLEENVVPRLDEKGLATSKAAALRELASLDVRTYPAMSRLRCCEKRNDVAQEIILDRVCEFLVVSEPASTTTLNLTAEGSPVLANIFRSEFVLPQVVARIIRLRGFLHRRVLLLPGCPTHPIHVNGQPVPETGTALDPGDEINFTPQMRISDVAFAGMGGVPQHLQGDGVQDITLLSPTAREQRLKRLAAVGIHPIVMRVCESGPGLDKVGTDASPSRKPAPLHVDHSSAL